MSILKMNFVPCIWILCSWSKYKTQTHCDFRNAKKSEDKVKQMEEDMEEGKTTIEELEKKFGEMTEKGKAVMEQWQKAKVWLKQFLYSY